MRSVVQMARKHPFTTGGFLAFRWRGTRCPAEQGKPAANTNANAIMILTCRNLPSGSVTSLNSEAPNVKHQRARATASRVNGRTLGARAPLHALVRPPH